MKIETKCAQETFALGEKLGTSAQPGQVYALTGGLGVGKTVFTQGLAAGLGIRGPVCSPTFTIVQIYEEGRLPFYHLRFSRFTKKAVCLSIISMFTESPMWTRWRKSVMRTAFTDKGSVWWNGRI